MKIKGKVRPHHYLLASFFGVVVLVLGLFAGVALVQNRSSLVSKAAPATTLSLQSASIKPIVGEMVTVKVMINSGTNSVVGSEIYLKYDPVKLEALSINDGSFLTDAQVIKREFDNYIGTISYISFVPVAGLPKSGSGVYAEVLFRAKSPGNTLISFTPQTLVSAVGDEAGVNALISSKSLTLRIQKPKGRK